jgi:hypothetical protein
MLSNATADILQTEKYRVCNNIIMIKGDILSSNDIRVPAENIIS